MASMTSHGFSRQSIENQHWANHRILEMKAIAQRRTGDLILHISHADNSYSQLQMCTIQITFQIAENNVQYAITPTRARWPCAQSRAIHF